MTPHRADDDAYRDTRSGRLKSRGMMSTEVYCPLKDLHTLIKWHRSLEHFDVSADGFQRHEVSTCMMIANYPKKRNIEFY